MNAIKQFWQGQTNFLQVDPDVTLDITVYQGGFGCVDGDTLLDLASGDQVKIKDFTGGYIWAWDGLKLVSAWATKPALYDKKPLYKVRTTTGQELTCTAEHRFLGPSGWIQTSHLSVGDEILTTQCAPEYGRGACDLDDAPLCVPTLQRSSLGHGLSARVAGVNGFQQTIPSFQWHYLACPRQYGAQPLWGQGSGLGAAPLQVCAHEHNLNWSDVDDQETVLNDTHPYRYSLPRSRPDSQPRLEPLVSALALSYAEQSTSALPWGISQQSPQSALNSSRPQQAVLSDQPFPNPSNISYKSLHNQNLQVSIVESIDYIKTDKYYDLHVPGLNNYIAHGFINHNSGKSFIGSYLGQRLAAKYPGSVGLVVGKTFPLIRDTTLKLHLELLAKYGLVKGKHYTYNKSEHLLTLHCWGGSEILFRHIQDENSIRSLTVGWIHIEEGSQLTETDYLGLHGRLRQTETPHCKIDRRRMFITTNPQPTKGWIHKFFVEKNPGKQTVFDDETGLTEVINYRRVISPTTDNKALPKAYIESMKQQFDPQYYNIYVLGMDGDYTSGLVSANWSKLNEVDTTYNPELPVYITCDFNVDPMMWCIVQRYNDEFYFIDEIVKENTSTVDCINEFIHRYGGYLQELNNKGIIINGDASGNNRSTLSAKANQTNYTVMRNELDKAGFSKVSVDIRSSNPFIKDREAAWQAAICNADGIRRVFVNPDKCPKLMENIYNLKYIEGTSEIYEPSRHEIEKDKNLKFLKHIWDAASYCVEKYAPVVLKVKARGKGMHVIDMGFDA